MEHLEVRNGNFLLESYGFRVTPTDPSVVPGSACKSAVFTSGIWTMKSGYGITFTWNPYLTDISGCRMPDISSHTPAQSIYAAFPEYGYSTVENEYRTLQYVNGSCQFAENADADGNERLHFIPVYIGNGNYTVYATAT